MKNSLFTLVGAIAFALILGSCEDKVENILEGPWSIDTLYYNGYNITNCVLSNVIIFKKTFCKLPTTENYCKGLIEYVDNGTWSTYRTETIPVLIEIESQNKIFSGNHRITFKKDEQNKLLKIQLKSDSFYLVARKGLFDYEGSQNLVKELIKLTHKE